MREILFKAKRVDNGKWVEGSYVYTFAPDKECPVVGVHKENHWIVEENGNIVIVDASTICQYTGLTDKNGKKIWENDVINKVDTNALGWHRERKCKVSFDELGYWLLTTEYGDGYWLGEFDSEQLEVIGNIFDNAELLEGGADHE